MTYTGGAQIRRLPFDAPWTWLAAGWRDLWRAPRLSVFFGAAAAAAGLLAMFILFGAGAGALAPLLLGGFALAAPVFALGLYEKSRRIEAGEPLSWKAVITPNLPRFSTIAYAGLALLLIYLLWIRAGTLLFALFLGQDFPSVIVGDYPPLYEFATIALTRPEGLALLAVGTLVGGALALVAFAISAVSLPMMLERDIDVLTAMSLSVRAVTQNPGAMLNWAWIIALMLVLSMALGYIGLVIAFPWIAHASWAAYRDVVRFG